MITIRSYPSDCAALGTRGTLGSVTNCDAVTGVGGTTRGPILWTPGWREVAVRGTAEELRTHPLDRTSPAVYSGYQTERTIFTLAVVPVGGVKQGVIVEWLCGEGTSGGLCRRDWSLKLAKEPMDWGEERWTTCVVDVLFPTFKVVNTLGDKVLQDEVAMAGAVWVVECVNDNCKINHTHD